MLTRTHILEIKKEGKKTRAIVAIHAICAKRPSKKMVSQVVKKI